MNRLLTEVISDKDTKPHYIPLRYLYLNVIAAKSNEQQIYCRAYVIITFQLVKYSSHR